MLLKIENDDRAMYGIMTVEGVYRLLNGVLFFMAEIYVAFFIYLYYGLNLNGCSIFSYFSKNVNVRYVYLGMT